MDPATLAAYDAAAAYAKESETQPAPVDLHDLIRHFFRPGLPPRPAGKSTASWPVAVLSDPHALRELKTRGENLIFNRYV